MISILSDEVKRCVAQPSNPKPPSGTSEVPEPPATLQPPNDAVEEHNSSNSAGNISYADAVAAPASGHNQRSPQPKVRDGTAETKVAEDGFTIVRQKGKRHAIKIIGDSMVCNIMKTVKCSEECSGCISLRGTGVKHVVSKACETAATMRENSLLVLVGGGTGLHALGPAETARFITESVRKMKKGCHYCCGGCSPWAPREPPI